MMWRGFTRGCPICGRRKIFKVIAMLDDCPRCGFHFERIEGHWVGAVGINTIVTFGTMGVFAAGGLIATYPDFAVVPLMIIGVAIATFLPILFHPSSRMVWTAIDLAMRPVQPDELLQKAND